MACKRSAVRSRLAPPRFALRATRGAAPQYRRAKPAAPKPIGRRRASAQTVFPSYVRPVGAARWPLALMNSDCRGPYHCGELEAHDGWRGVPGFGVTVSFITSECLPN